jgi:parallel beta-helix repeat protein
MVRFTLLIGLAIIFASISSLAFNVRKGEASGTIYIRADGLVDGTDKIATADNVTYTFIGNVSDSIVVLRNNIVIDGAGFTLQGTGSEAGINLSGRTNVTVQNTQIEDFYWGIYLNDSSDFNNINGNNIKGNNWSGIQLSSSYGNSISGNNITNSGIDIKLHASSNNRVSGNRMRSTAFGGDGMQLESSSNNNVEGNTIADIDNVGIWLYTSSNFNSISGNSITNAYIGIQLESSSNNNITGNTVTNNDEGISIDNQGSGNRIYHNNFVGNTNQAYAKGTTDVWDNGYPSGGNYWSDYNGTDANHDGIGDSSYVIDGNNIDYYPLVNQYVVPEFPSFLIPPLFMIVTLLTVVIYRKRN